jgi:hypothetical protein
MYLERILREKLVYAPLLLTWTNWAISLKVKKKIANEHIIKKTL